MSEQSAAVIPGRSVVTARAYEQLVRAIGGRALAVRPRDTSVHVSDSGGQLLIEITAPISPAGLTVLERVEHTRTTVAERTTALTGASVDRVTVHVTDIRSDERRAR